MKLTILLLPTLLAAGFVLALSTEVSAPDTSATLSSRSAEIRELHQLLNKTAGRLAILEPVPHNFVPRGASATDYPARPVTTSCAQPAVTVCAADNRVAKQRTS